MTPPQIYWRLRETYHLPRFLARPLAQFWQKQRERVIQRVRREAIIPRKLEDHTMTFTVNVIMSRELRMRVWTAGILVRLAAWVLGCGFKKRVAGEWHQADKDYPPANENILLWECGRCVVGFLGEDWRYYMPQEAAPLSPQFWAYLPPLPDDAMVKL
jgi:hypothetical protein